MKRTGTMERKWNTIGTARNSNPAEVAFSLPASNLCSHFSISAVEKATKLSLSLTPSKSHYKRELSTWVSFWRVGINHSLQLSSLEGTRRSTKRVDNGSMLAKLENPEESFVLLLLGESSSSIILNFVDKTLLNRVGRTVNTIKRVVYIGLHAKTLIFS